ncbi:MAG TPA: iron transporter [Terriglobales bacterium]|nr:iron transporter [Terriglobales bacterium]
MKRSEEADRQGLELARAQGRAVQRTVRHMAKKVAEDGREQEAGEYVIGYAIEKAEGLYHLHDGKLEWREPEDENVHLEIAVCDGSDGRFIPGLKVRVTMLDSEGSEIGTHEHPLLWHPYLYHYGRNWKVPGDGKYTIRVHVDTPDFPRHDRVNGRRFTKPVETEFRWVEIKTGQG